MTFVESINILALIVSPIAAVLISIWIADQGEIRKRKLETFRTLMRTRGIRLSSDHVGALNLVEIEFAKETNVISAWKTYLEHLDGSKTPLPVDPNTSKPFFDERNRRLAKLLHEIGISLGFKVEQIDIFMGNYTPQGWLNDEDQQRFLRGLMIDVLGGRRALTVMPHNPNPHAGIFPPPPTDPNGNLRANGSGG